MLLFHRSTVWRPTNQSCFSRISCFHNFSQYSTGYCFNVQTLHFPKHEFLTSLFDCMAVISSSRISNYFRIYSRLSFFSSFFFASSFLFHLVIASHYRLQCTWIFPFCAFVLASFFAGF